MSASAPAAQHEVTGAAPGPRPGGQLRRQQRVDAACTRTSPPPSRTRTGRKWSSLNRSLLRTHVLELARARVGAAAMNASYGMRPTSVDRPERPRELPQVAHAAAPRGSSVVASHRCSSTPRRFASCRTASCHGWGDTYDAPLQTPRLRGRRCRSRSWSRARSAVLGNGERNEVPHAVPAPARSVLLIRGAGAGPAGLGSCAMPASVAS